MRLVLLGPPGAGKGTHAQVLSKEFEITHVSTGEMLREALRVSSPLGLEAKQYMDKGELVPDEVVMALVAERLSKPDAAPGFILDGFPRTRRQGEGLDRTLRGLRMPLDLVVYFKTSAEVIVSRLSGRRVCGQCGKNYHVKNFRPKVDGICDVCGRALVQRPDDREETIGHRLEVYEEQTAPLVEYYRKKGLLVEVSGDLDLGPLQAVLAGLFHQKGLLPAKA
ncbi:MAG: adenylate kinase [Candidatus Omnitrophica bacterium]|nr:adenylate kinase [Candidatus Omnitrophota bacterium]